MACHTLLLPKPHWCFSSQTSDVIRTLIGNKIVDHSDVVGASPVGDFPLPQAT